MCGETHVCKQYQAQQSHLVHGSAVMTLEHLQQGNHCKSTVWDYKFNVPICSLQYMYKPLAPSCVSKRLRLHTHLLLLALQRTDGHVWHLCSWSQQISSVANQTVHPLTWSYFQISTHVYMYACIYYTDINTLRFKISVCLSVCV